MAGYAQTGADSIGVVTPNLVDRCTIDGHGDIAIGIRHKREAAALVERLVVGAAQVGIEVEDRRERIGEFGLVVLDTQFLKSLGLIGTLLDYITVGIHHIACLVEVSQCLLGSLTNLGTKHA